MAIFGMLKIKQMKRKNNPYTLYPIPYTFIPQMPFITHFTLRPQNKNKHNKQKLNGTVR